MKKVFSIVFLLVVLVQWGQAQVQGDSIAPLAIDSLDSVKPKSPSFFVRQHQWMAKNYRMVKASDPYALLHSVYVGVPLIVGGFVAKHEDKKLRNMRTTYLKEFHLRIDDAMQYLPGAVMLGMKIGGVESRSSWGRMLTSDAFASALMALAVNSLKTTTRVTRPDGSSNNSFPSGHTATAFMTATMLSREYGDRLPAVSIAGYTVATATGLWRMANNRHWLSDVMVGAGIGIVSTELGYFLADLIFKEKGMKRYDRREEFERYDKPSFVGIYLGFNVPLSTIMLPGGHSFRTSSGINCGIEGAKYINPYLGFGGRISAANLAFTLDNVAATKTFDHHSAYAGVYGSYPLSSRFRVGGKFLSGYTYYPERKIDDYRLGDTGNIGFATGLSVSFKAHPNYHMSSFVDYDLLPSCVPGTHRYLHSLTLGFEARIAF